MPVWRCPHCATPQAEASRCWVCRRSTTSCVTCRHYRRGISGGLGLCGLDPRHPAVASTDVQPCWVGADAVPEPVAGRASRRDPTGPEDGGRHAPRTFVPVETLLAGRSDTGVVAVLERPTVAAVEAATEPAAAPDPLPEATPGVTPPAIVADRPVPGRWWLWGDPDPWPDRHGERWA